MGKVRRVLPNGNISVKYKDVPASKLYISIKKADLEGVQYQPGNDIRCKVLSVEEVEEGSWEVRCKRSPVER